MDAQRGSNHERVSEIHSSMGPVGAFDNSPLHLTIEKLNGKNYREWAQAIKLVIDGKGKLGFLTGETRRPPPTTSDRCSSISEMAEIGKSRNTTTEMLGLWQELDLSCEEEWECTGDSVRFKKKMENERVFEFLAGLNHELDDVRSRVLSRRPLPPSEKSSLRCGERRAEGERCWITQLGLRAQPF
ncbi:hypothetical protein CK203_006577 [Vitis vinifera]|uniref:Retrotransposon Copia-like N-terminal domain-containing protein n=1 Tax=Vitis vinifera TaxID=29760 RepID=A0A438KAJ7_VITVI|nr:hypothetical protein CK203_006577 [Vitis vinifera]